jgi:hypothetical protein
VLEELRQAAVPKAVDPTLPLELARLLRQRWTESDY